MLSFRAGSAVESGDEGGDIIQDELENPGKTNEIVPALGGDVDISDDEGDFKEFEEIEGGENVDNGEMSGEDLTPDEGGEDLGMFDERNELGEMVEQLFLIIDDDGDGFIFDEDAEVFKKRLKTFPKMRFGPLIEWMKRIPTHTIRNMSKNQFLESVEKALREECFDDESKAVGLCNRLIGTLREAQQAGTKKAAKKSARVVSFQASPKGSKGSKHEHLSEKRCPSESPASRMPKLKYPASHIESGWHRAKYDIDDQLLHQGDVIFKERFAYTSKRSPTLSRPRSLGPVDIGRVKGWKPAKYDY